MRSFLCLIVLITVGCDKSSFRPKPEDLQLLRLKLRIEPLPQAALTHALEYLEANTDHIPNQQYLTLIDFSRFSGEPRLFIINLQTGEYDSLLTAHGKGSDVENTGYAQVFSNIVDSHTSSLGFYLAAEEYVGEYGRALRLDGLSESNSRARERSIVIHGARYVDRKLEKMGRSFGCPAVEYKWINTVVDRLAGGSLIFASSEALIKSSGEF